MRFFTAIECGDGFADTGLRPRFFFDETAGAALDETGIGEGEETGVREGEAGAGDEGGRMRSMFGGRPGDGEGDEREGLVAAPVSGKIGGGSAIDVLMELLQVLLCGGCGLLIIEIGLSEVKSMG